MEYLNIISIILEIVVVVFALMIAMGKRRTYGWGLTLTFFVYVFYDSARTFGWEISSSVMTLSFLVATISAVIAVYSIYKS